MGPASCDEIRSALLWTLTSSRLPLQTFALSRHLVRCPECQALRSHVLGLLLPGADEPAYGDQGEIVLDEDESGGHSFQLSVHPEPDGTWAIIVALIPPVTGQAVIEIGDALFYAPFNAQGVGRAFASAQLRLSGSLPWPRLVRRAR